MKKHVLFLFRVLTLVLFVFLMSNISFTADFHNEPIGPAPNAGDGIPDGSGMDNRNGNNEDGTGPAPNSGDGIPDGSGF